MKKLIAAVTAAGLLVAGTAGMAGAATTQKPKDAATSRPARERRVLTGLKVAATTIGIEPKALLEAVRGGQSVADVAKAHDVEPQKVVDAVVAAATKKIDDAMTAGKIDADRAAKLKDRLPKVVDKLVNGTLSPRAKQRIGRAVVRRHARRGGAIIAAKTIGIEPKALAEAVRSGQSVAEVAQSHDVDPQTVIDAVVAAGTTKIDAAATAGKIDADRAAAMKERLPQRVARLVNAKRAVGAAG